MKMKFRDEGTESLCWRGDLHLSLHSLTSLTAVLLALMTFGVASTVSGKLILSRSHVSSIFTFILSICLIEFFYVKRRNALWTYF